MAAQQPTDAIQNAATQYKLGIPQAVYEGRKESWWYRLPGIFALLIGSAMLYYFIHAYADVFSGWPTWQVVFMLLIGGGWICVGLWILLAPWHSPAPRIFVYTEGIIYATRKIEVMRWDQMERLWKDIRLDTKMRKTCSYVIRRNDQTLFVFKSSPLDGEKPIMHLEKEITYRLLPRAIAAYNTGNPILFDDIAISRRWLRIREGGKMLWSEFERIYIDDQTIAIYKKGMVDAWASLAVSTIPNVEILRGLVNYAQQAQLLPQSSSIRAYKAGYAVSFGPLAISTRGIEINRTIRLPWSEVAGIAVGASEVMIKKKDGTWYAFPLWMIPNSASLKELIAHILI